MSYFILLYCTAVRLVASKKKNKLAKMTYNMFHLSVLNVKKIYKKHKVNTQFAFSGNIKFCCVPDLAALNLTLVL